MSCATSSDKMLGKLHTHDSACRMSAMWAAPARLTLRRDGGSLLSFVGVARLSGHHTFVDAGLNPQSRQTENCCHERTFRVSCVNDCLLDGFKREIRLFRSDRSRSDHS